MERLVRQKEGEVKKESGEAVIHGASGGWDTRCCSCNVPTFEVTLVEGYWYCVVCRPVCQEVIF